MTNFVSSSTSNVLVRMRLTVLRIGFRFRLAMARVRTPAPSRLLLALLASSGMPALANPTGGQVASGGITINAPQNGSMNIVQTTNKGVIDWQTFNVAAGEKVNFLQPGSTSSTLNRVVGNDASTIFGQINANGQVFLLNQNGILFAPGSQVNVGGLVASTLQLSDGDYLAGRYGFSGGSSGAGSVTNQGAIKAGFVVLAAPQVTNLGSIVADGGTVALAAGGRVTMNLLGSDVVSVSVDAPTVAALVHAGGIVQADGGKVLITAKAAGALLDTVVNVDGIVQARSIGTRNGAIVLDGGSTGVVSASGRLDASGNGAGQTGGTVKMLGHDVGLFGTGTVDVSGDAGGGVVRIGGDWHGAGADGDANASQVYAGAGTSISADARTRGNGGNVVLWSDDRTVIAGSISARGGAVAGDGGAIETSSHNVLQATAKVTAMAPHGKGGSWLLDPNDITIGTGGTSGIAESGNVWSDTSGNSTLNNVDLSNSLASGTSVTVLTASGSNTTGSITVSAPITTPVGFTSGTGVLNLDAQGDISFTSSGSIAIGASGIGLTVNLNGGTMSNGTGAGTHASNINMASGSFINTGTGDFSATAKGTVNLAALTVGGNATINAAGNVTQSGALSILGATAVTTSSGNITLTDSGNHIAAFSATDTDAAGGATHGNVSVTTAGALALGAVNGGSGTALDGKLTVIAGGDVTQTAAALVGGLTSVATTAGNIALTNVGNNLAAFSAVDTDTTGGVSHGNVSVTTTGALSLGAVNGGSGAVLDGDLAVVAGGDVTQTARFLVNGVTRVTTSSGNITLTNTNNSLAAFGATDTDITGGASHGNVTVTTAGPVLLSDVNGGTGVALDGALTITTAGSLGQLTGTSVLVGGATAVTTSAGNIALTNAGNHLASFSATDTDSTGGVNHGNVSVTTTGALALGAVDGGGSAVLNGDLTVVAGGDVTQTARFLVNGVTRVTTSAGNITLTNTSNSLAAFGATDTDTTGGASHGNVTVRTAGPVLLSDVNGGTGVALDGALTITTAGSLGQLTGTSLLVGGATAATTNAGNIALTEAGNTLASFSATDTDNTGGVNHGNVSVTTTGALALGAVNGGSGTALDGKLTVIAGGDVTQTAAALVGGLTSVATTAGNIALTNVGNNLATFSAVDTDTTGGVSHGNVSVTTTGALALGAVNGGGGAILDGDLAVVAGGDVTQTARFLVNGVTRVTTSSGNITLTNTGNSLAAFGATDTDTAGGASHGNVTVTTAGPVLLSDVNGGTGVALDGALTITTGGSLGQLTGTSALVGGATVATTSAGNIALTNAGNHLAAFSATDTDTTGGVNHGNVSVTTTGALALGAINGGSGTVLDGDLTVVTGGDVTQSARFLVNGVTQVTTSSGNITLTNTGNSLAAFGATDTDTTGGASHGNVTVTAGGPILLSDVNGGTGVALDGALTITAAGDLGQLTGTSLLVGGATAATTSAGNIVLTNTGNQLVSFGATNTNGAGSVSVTTTGALTLGDINGGSGTNLGGNLTVNAGGTVSQAGGARVLVGHSTTVTTTAGNVTLTNTGNRLHSFGATDTDTTAGNGNVSILTSGSVALNDVNGGTGIALAGGLTVSAVGDVTQTASTNLLVGGQTEVDTTAGNIAVGSVGSALTTFRASNTDVSAGHGGVAVTTGGALALDNVSAASLTVGTAGAVTQVASTVLHVAGATTVNSGAGDIVLNGDNVMTSFGGSTTGNATVRNTQALDLGNLSVGNATLHTGTATITTTAGDLTQSLSNGVTVEGAMVLDAQAGNVSLASTHNDFVGGVSATGHSIALTDANDLNVVALNLVAPSGNVALKAVAGSLNVASADFALGAGDLLLSSGGPGGITTGTLSAHDITVESGGGVTVAHNLTATHDLTITNDGSASAITQSAGTTVNVGGSTTITAGSGSVSLVGDGNNVFTGLVQASGGTIDIRALSGLDAHVTATSAVTLDAGTGSLSFQASTGGDLTANGSSVQLGANTIPGSLSVTTTGGAITQSGALTVTGSTTLNANGGNVTLTTPTNDFVGDVTAAGAAIGIADKNALVVHGTAAGDANYQAVGALTVDGATTGTLTVGGSSIAFGSAAANTTTAGALVANSTGATTQLGGLSVGGTSTLTGAPGSAITLDLASNDFGGAVTVSGGAITLADANTLAVHLGSATTALLTAAGALGVDGSTTGALHATGAGVQFGATNVGGTLGVTATGAVGQTGSLVVAGATTIAAGANNVTLNDPLHGNSFGAGVTVAGGAVDVEQAAALVAHLSGVGSTVLKSGAGVSVDGTSTGDLAVTAGGAVTQVADLSVAGSTTLAAGAHDITLDRAGNAFGGAVVVSGAKVNIAAGGALTVAGTSSADMTLAGNSVTFGDGGTTVGGNLDVASSGAPHAVAQAAGTTPLAAAAGAIVQTGALGVTGTTTLDAGAGDITLTNAANNFTGLVTATGKNVAITTAGSLHGAINALGDAVLAANGGDLVVDGAITGGLTATGSSVTVAEGGAMTFGGAVDAMATAGDITFGTIHANGVTANASGNVLLDGTLGSSEAVSLSGAAVQGANSRGVLDVQSGKDIFLAATSGNIGRDAAAVTLTGRPDPVSVITLTPQTGQGSVVTLQFEPGHTAWFSVTSKQLFANIQFQPASLNLSTFGCDATTCFNVLGQTTSIADSVIANILSAASQDARDAAFGTENLDIAIRKGYVTTIGRVPPGIDEIAGDLGGSQCDSRVTSSKSIDADKACPVKAK